MRNETVLSAVDLRAGSVRAASLAVALFPRAHHRLLQALDAKSGSAAWERLGREPLRAIVASEVDFERVPACGKVRVFVSGTHVRTGRLKEFRQTELSADAVMASACLPLMCRAVDIDGEAYGDGGYLGNRSLFPLIAESPARDLVLVQINPSRREGLPTTVADILDRLNEITFNSSLFKELRSVALLAQLLRLEGAPPGAGRAPLFTQISALRMHRIDAEAELAELGAASKTDTAWPFLPRLQRIARRSPPRGVSSC